MSAIRQLLVEKYRPTTIDDYIYQNDNHRAKFNEYIQTGSIPNLLLSGTQGTGKSTIARILVKALNVDPDMDVLVLNASDDNSVDDVRDRIKLFITTYSMSGMKIVLMEEADRLSKAAQKALKVLTEDFSDVARFIITCNHEHLLDKALKSRFQQFKFTSPDVNDVTARIAQILALEGVKSKLEMIDKFVAIGFPDIRQTIQLVEQHIVDGKLIDPQMTLDGADWKVDLLSMIESGDWKASRALLCGSIGNEEWDEVYTFIYRNINKVSVWDPLRRDQAVVTIAQHLYQHSLVADPEINAASMLIELSRI